MRKTGFIIPRENEFEEDEIGPEKNPGDKQSESIVCVKRRS